MRNAVLRRSVLLIAMIFLGWLPPAHAQTTIKITPLPPESPPTPMTTAVTEAAVADALLARWLAAQNGGDFAAYQALYAASFTGIKRVGKQTKKLDRAAWMKDRSAMFKAKMTVSATQRAYGRDVEGFYVEFTQRWEQGAFADAGTKRLRLELRLDAAPPAPATILAEEMLTSRVIPTEDACVRALFPEARAGRIGATTSSDLVRDVEILDLEGEIFVCRVEHGPAAERDGQVELGLVKRGKGWALLAERSYPVRAKGPTVSDPDQTETESALRLEAIQISPREQALLVEEEARTVTWMTDDGSRNAELFRVTAGSFDSVLEYKSTWSDGEASDRTTCQLEMATRKTRGTFDAVVRCARVVGHWHSENPKENGETTTKEVHRYRWDGTSYAE